MCLTARGVWCFKPETWQTVAGVECTNVPRIGSSGTLPGLVFPARSCQGGMCLTGRGVRLIGRGVRLIGRDV
jgi:hypothetical protein